MSERKTHMVSHHSRPAEPWGTLGAVGRVLRVTPSGRMIPAQAYIEWPMVAGRNDDLNTNCYHTWESCKDMSLFGEATWADAMADTRDWS